MTAPLATRFRNQTLIQYASVWPTSDPGWISIRAWAEKACDGLANDIGSASFAHPAGNILWPGDTVPIATTPLGIAGKYVRICIEDAAGTIVDATSLKNYTPIWWGKIMGKTFLPNAEKTGLNVGYSCAGLMMILDQIMPFKHYQVGSTGDIADITVPMTFNGKGSQKTGNRSAATYPVGGSNVFVFAPEDNADQWTALDVLEYLLALAKATNPGGPVWTVAGATAALNYTEKWELSGMSIMEAISRLISPRQGLGFRVVMSGFQPQIFVMSLSATSVVANPDYTLPASVDQVSLDLTDPSEILEFTISEDQTATYGKIAIIGGPDIYAITLMADGDDTGQLIRDWDGADETAYDLLDDADKGQGELAKVYRRFKIPTNWNGQSYNGDLTIPSARLTASSGPHGVDGYTGAVTIGENIRGINYRLTRDLPVPAGYDWDTQVVVDADLTKKAQELQCFVLLGSTWMTLAEYCDGRSSVQIEVDEDNAAVTVGPADVADYIRDLFAGGGELYFTLGIKSQLPLMVSWNASTEPTEQARSIIRERPQMTRKTIGAGTIFRVEAEAAMTRVAETVVADDVDDMLAVLALAVPWYSNPDWQVSWAKRGEIGTAYGNPGTLYTDITYPISVGVTALINTAAIVTRREWDFSDEQGMTRVTTKRIKLDIETVF